MGWFNDQLKQRYYTEQTNFVASLDSIINSVLGKEVSQALEDTEVAKSAIDQILNYFHLPAKDEEPPAECKTIDEQIAFYTRPYGLISRNVKLEKHWEYNATGAMIGTLKEDNTAVALIPHGFFGYSFTNIKTGKTTKLNSKTEKLLNDYAICFYEPFPQHSLTIKDLLVFMGKQLNKFDIILYLSLLAFSTLLGMLSPKFSQWLFGNVIASGSTKVLCAISCFIICYSGCRVLFETFRTIINSGIGTKCRTATEIAVMARIMSLPTSFFRQYSTGDLSLRASYFRTLCLTLTDTITNTGFTTLFSLVYVSQIFVFAPALAMPSLLIMLFNLLICIISVSVEMKYTEKNMKIMTELEGLTYSAVSGIQKVKLAGVEKRMFTKWANLYSLKTDPPTFLKYNKLFTSAVTITGTLVLYYLAIKSNVEVANYYAFTSSFGALSAAFASLNSIISSLALVKPTINMAKPIMETEPEQTDSKKRITSSKGAVEFSHITFRYSDDMPNVIDDFSLKIKPNEYVAIVGSTGCGKSTLARLLLGFEKPQKGSIYFDGKDISKINLESYRKKIGAVIQNGKLVYGDIYSNIVIASPQSTLEDAWKAAEIACIAKDIKEMPMGMFTIVSESQGGLSGGQRQRIMIARALVSKPKLLIFDEATSALDNITQKTISSSIDNLNCTRIVIAHRLSTIQNADRILYLENGRIAEEGTYSELIALNKKFASLVERQRIDI